MLDVKEAIKIVNKNIPTGKIQSYIVYKNVYLFQVFTNVPGESEFDPFYSVDKETGEFRDFSIITDGNISEISTLFEKAKNL